MDEMSAKCDRSLLVHVGWSYLQAPRSHCMLGPYTPVDPDRPKVGEERLGQLKLCLLSHFNKQTTVNLQ